MLPEVFVSHSDHGGGGSLSGGEGSLPGGVSARRESLSGGVSVRRGISVRMGPPSRGGPCQEGVSGQWSAVDTHPTVIVVIVVFVEINLYVYDNRLLTNTYLLKPKYKTVTDMRNIISKFGNTYQAWILQEYPLK